MKILFTKNLDKQMISEKLGNHFYCDFLEVIRPEILQINSFELSNNSLIFTSINGVKGFVENGFKINSNPIYCVGIKTKKALQKEGFSVLKVCDDAKQLAHYLKTEAANEEFIHFCGTISLDILSSDFSDGKYRKVVVYKTHLLYPKINKLYDAFVFFSPSGVRSFVKHNSVENILLFSIGKTTETELKKYTNSRVLYSDRSNLEDLLSIIKNENTH